MSYNPGPATFMAFDNPGPGPVVSLPIPNPRPPGDPSSPEFPMLPITPYDPQPATPNWQNPVIGTSPGDYPTPYGPTNPQPVIISGIVQPTLPVAYYPMFPSGPTTAQQNYVS